MFTWHQAATRCFADQVYSWIHVYFTFAAATVLVRCATHIRAQCHQKCPPRPTRVNLGSGPLPHLVWIVFHMSTGEARSSFLPLRECSVVLQAKERRPPHLISPLLHLQRGRSTIADEAIELLTRQCVNAIGILLHLRSATINFWQILKAPSMVAAV